MELNFSQKTHIRRLALALREAEAISDEEKRERVKRVILEKIKAIWRRKK